MAKRIAVLVRERQSEALRMAIGLTLRDDVVDVYVLDRPLAATETNALNLETMKELTMQIYTNYRGNAGMSYLPTREIAGRLPVYDHILAY
ncbi:MAG TPA: hypothetical protein VMH06_02170 [Thermodesulfovibrionales bacterium]|nr:hypothetical protein [Thermodesulfovibrionales bacterium]